MRNHIQAAVILGLSSALLASCSNSSLQKLAKSSNSGPNGASNLIINYGTFNIAGVDVGSSATSDATGLPITITFNLSTTNASMMNNCTADTGNSPCVCKFSWKETNSTGGTPVTVSRFAITNVTDVSLAQVKCTTPPKWTEIPDNTSISISVLPATSDDPKHSNPNQFTVNPYGFAKGTTSKPGNFTDAMGRSFVNILRYSCYEQRKRGLMLQNRLATQTISNIGTFGFLISNQFCLRDHTNNVKGGQQGCEMLPEVDYSAQSYYYNLYIRDNESGDANPGNAAFVCPAVTEALNQQAGNPGTQGKFWPMDTSFALSMGKTSDFSVGVIALSKATNLNDPYAVNTACDGTTSKPASANSFISTCLGFAAKPNVNGTCPKLTVNKVSGSCPDGAIDIGSSSTCLLPTYRLRRYITVYPTFYDTDGKPIAKDAQRTDMVYVLDRPVVDPLSTDPSTRYSMLGPKPCPFAYYDNGNVTTLGQGYVGTNNPKWNGTDGNGTNVDNIFFPYQDSDFSGGQGTAGTCAAMLPVVDSSAKSVSLAKVTTKKYVRPQKAWAAHYEEDTGFQGCAPQSNPLRDPPLHLVDNGSGQQAWCAEVYPTKNTQAPNAATNSTTHASSGGTDRTVVVPSGGTSWTKFPILAPEADVVSALQSDSSFGCGMTLDKDGTKLGISPTGGCCASVSFSGGAAHLEPTAASTPPTYSCNSPNY